MTISDTIQVWLKNHAIKLDVQNPTVKWAGIALALLVVLAAAFFAIPQQNLSAQSRAAVLVEPAVPVDKTREEQALLSTIRTQDKLATKPSIWPVTGEVTSGFGWRSSPWESESGNEMHPGLDIANSMDTPIVATADGVVVQSGWAGGYGNLVQIDHGNGMASLYGHNARLAVNVGDKVKKGQVISYMGSTGRSTGPHVHYEIRVNGSPVDPISFMVAY